MKLQLRYPAGPHQRFAAGAFDRAVGKELVLREADPAAGAATCRLTDAELEDDGAAALLSFDVDPDSLGALLEAAIGSTLRWGHE